MLVKEFQIPKFLFLILSLSALILILLISDDLSPQIVWFFDPTSSYWLNNSVEKSRYFLSSFSFSALIVFTIYSSSNIILGLAFIQSVNNSIFRYFLTYKFTIPLLLLCYPIGSVISTAINRIITLFFGNYHASLVIYIFYALIILFFMQIKTKFIILNFYNTFKTIQSLSINALCICLSFIFFVILLHYQNQHIVGDGVKFTFEIIDNETNFNPWEKLPLIAKHYDELLYLYPLIMLVKVFKLNQNNLLLFFWLHYSLIKIGCLILLISSGKYVGLSIKQSTLLGLCCFFANPYINPFRIRLIFDSGQPIAYSLHSGRVMIDVFVVYLTTLFIRKGTFGKIGIRSVLLLSFFSVGLASLSISAALALIGIASGIFSNILQFSKKHYLMIFGILIYGFIISSILLVYKNSTSYSYIPLGSSIFLSFILFMYFFSAKLMSNKFPGFDLETELRFNFTNTILLNKFLYFLLIGISYSLSLKYLGNVFIGDPSWLEHIGQRIIGSNIDVKRFGIGAGSFCGQFPFSCSSSNFFVEAYGFPFFLASLNAILIYYKLSSLAKKYTINSLFFLFFYCCTLFFFTFMNEGAINWLDVWVKSRIPEPFFYSSIFFSIVSMYKINIKSTNSSFNLFSQIINFNIIDLYLLSIFIISFISQSYFDVFKANLNYLRHINFVY